MDKEFLVRQKFFKNPPQIQLLIVDLLGPKISILFQVKMAKFGELSTGNGFEGYKSNNELKGTLYLN